MYGAIIGTKFGRLIHQSPGCQNILAPYATDPIKHNKRAFPERGFFFRTVEGIHLGQS